MPVNERLAKKGMDEPRAGLVEQGKASAEVATRNADPLAANNWQAEKTAQLRAQVALLETEVAEQVEARREKEGAVNAKELAVDNAKAFIRRLRLSLPECLQTSEVRTVTAKSFEIGADPLKRTPRNIAKYLVDIRVPLAALDADLAPYFNSVLPTTILDTRKVELDVANAIRQVAIGELPEATQEVYEAKGRLLDLIENLNRAGKRAFDGDAVKIAQFNKDILVNARKKRKPATDPSPLPVA